MFQLFIISFICIILSACGKSFVTPPAAQPEPEPIMTISSTYLNVDYVSFGLTYNDRSINGIQVRRDSVEVPPTVYDGELVFLDSLFLTTFKDSHLSKNEKYNYSIFYYDEVSWKLLTNKTVTTLTKKEGMQQLINELIQYANSKSQYFEYILSGENIDLFFESNSNVELDESSYAKTLRNNIDGVLVKNLNYQGIDDSNCSAATNKDSLYQKINTLRATLTRIPIFAVDYCVNATKVSAARTVLSNNSMVGYNRSITSSNVFESAPLSPLESNPEHIFELRRNNIQSFIFLDEPVNDMLSSLSASNYDLIIMTPFPDSLVNTMFTHENIVSLKQKANGKNRLVFAYFNIGRLFNSFYYFDSSWNIELPDSGWIMPGLINGNQYKIKYWRDEWKTDILIKMIDNAHKADVDGFVFDGIHNFTD